MTELGTAGRGRICFSTALSQKINGAAMIFIGAGIHKESNECLKTVSAYDLSTNSVKEVPSLSEPRSSHTSCIVGKSLFVIGGYSESFGQVNCMEALDLTQLN